MNTNHMAYILEVYRCGSINKAAAACYISQSQLSKIIQSVESELGFAIMLRSKSGLEFTRAGLLFIESIEKIVAELNMIQRIPDLLTEPQDLNIAIAPDSFLLKCFLDFKHRFPAEAVKDVAKESGLQETMQLILTGKTQLGIMAMFAQREEKYRELSHKYNLEFRPLKTNIPIVALMRKSHPMARKEGILAEDFKNYTYVVDAQVDYEDTLSILGLQENENVFSVTGLTFFFDALSKTNYMATMLKTVEPDLTSYGLCSRPILDLNTRGSIYYLRQAKLPASTREKQFLEYLKTRLDVFFKTG